MPRRPRNEYSIAGIEPVQPKRGNTRKAMPQTGFDYDASADPLRNPLLDGASAELGPTDRKHEADSQDKRINLSDTGHQAFFGLKRSALPDEDSSDSAEWAKARGDVIRDALAPSYLQASLSHITGGMLDFAAFRSYLGGLMEKCGNPADPLEQMLIEQLAWAHHAIGRLHVAAAKANAFQEAEVYNAAVARLMAECRRTSLAIATYRAPPAVKQSITLSREATLNGNARNGHAHCHRENGTSPLPTYDELRNGKCVMNTRNSPNPARVEAGRKNRLKRRGLTGSRLRPPSARAFLKTSAKSPTSSASKD